MESMNTLSKEDALLFHKLMDSLLLFVNQKTGIIKNYTVVIDNSRLDQLHYKVLLKVAHFNENLERGGEDTEFFYKCVKNGVKIIREKSARVEWGEVKTLYLKTFLQKVFVYSKGDGQAKIWWHPTKQLSSHNIRISAIFTRYLIGTLLLVYSFFNPSSLPYFIILVTLYLFYPIIKWKSLIKGNLARLYLPIIQVLTDFVTMYGFLAGTIGVRSKIK